MTTKGVVPAGPGEEIVIQVEDDVEEPIEFHIDDVIAFILFWALGGVTFLQFFTRYVLNDSVAWTEEVGRYLLMWVTFFGAAIVFRRRSNIAVDIIVDTFPPTAGRACRFVADAITVCFVGILVWFSWTITQRMSIQRMTVIDVSMAVIYGGIGIGCLLMFWRAVEAFIANARRGWRPLDVNTHLTAD
ncbi:TRAP transporter small permease [Agrobacterium sp. ES01]|uniref:TRAP transporter small permease n=1 Tax=Agrobacterium sp. ES01 TaxID=3420714 RepID=UPI003D10E984